MILGILIGLTLISIVVQGGNGEVLNETFEDVFVPFSRKVILPVSQFVAGSYRNFIPFSNVVSGIWRVFVSAFLEITVDCPIEWGDASLKLAQSSLSLLKSIFYYIISLAQEDFDLQTPISEFQDGTKLILSPFASCYCDVIDFAIQPIIVALTSHQGAAVLDRLLNLSLNIIYAIMETAIQFFKNFVSALFSGNFTETLGDFYWDPFRAPTARRIIIPLGELIARLGDWLDDVLGSVLANIFTLVEEEDVPRFFAILGNMFEYAARFFNLIAENLGFKLIRNTVMFGIRFGDDTTWYSRSNPIEKYNQELITDAYSKLYNSSVLVEAFFRKIAEPLGGSGEIQELLELVGCMGHEFLDIPYTLLELTTRATIALFHERLIGGDYLDFIRNDTFQATVDELVASLDRFANCTGAFYTILNDPLGKFVNETGHVLKSITMPIVDIFKNWKNRRTYITSTNFLNRIENIFFELDSWWISGGNVIRQLSFSGNVTTGPYCILRNPHVTNSSRNKMPFIVDPACCLGNIWESLGRIVVSFYEGVIETIVIFITSDDIKDAFLEAFGAGGPLDLNVEFIPMIDELLKNSAFSLCLRFGAVRVITDNYFPNSFEFVNNCQGGWETMVDGITSLVRLPALSFLRIISTTWGWIVSAIADQTCSQTCWCFRIKTLYSITIGAFVDAFSDFISLFGCLLKLPTDNGFKRIGSAMKTIFGTQGTLVKKHMLCFIPVLIDQLLYFFKCLVDNPLTCIAELIKKILLKTNFTFIFHCIKSVFERIGRIFLCIKNILTHAISMLTGILDLGFIDALIRIGNIFRAIGQIKVCWETAFDDIKAECRRADPESPPEPTSPIATNIKTRTETFSYWATRSGYIFPNSTNATVPFPITRSDIREGTYTISSVTTTTTTTDLSMTISQYTIEATFRNPFLPPFRTQTFAKIIRTTVLANMETRYDINSTSDTETYLVRRTTTTTLTTTTTTTITTTTVSESPLLPPLLPANVYDKGRHLNALSSTTTTDNEDAGSTTTTTTTNTNMTISTDTDDIEIYCADELKIIRDLLEKLENSTNSTANQRIEFKRIYYEFGWCALSVSIANIGDIILYPFRTLNDTTPLTNNSEYDIPRDIVYNPWTLMSYTYDITAITLAIASHTFSNPNLTIPFDYGNRTDFVVLYGRFIEGIMNGVRNMALEYPNILGSLLLVLDDWNNLYKPQNPSFSELIGIPGEEMEVRVLSDFGREMFASYKLKLDEIMDIWMQTTGFNVNGLRQFQTFSSITQMGIAKFNQKFYQNNSLVVYAPIGTSKEIKAWKRLKAYETDLSPYEASFNKSEKIAWAIQTRQTLYPQLETLAIENGGEEYIGQEWCPSGDLTDAFTEIKCADRKCWTPTGVPGDGTCNTKSIIGKATCGCINFNHPACCRADSCITPTTTCAGGVFVKDCTECVDGVRGICCTVSPYISIHTGCPSNTTFFAGTQNTSYCFAANRGKLMGACCTSNGTACQLSNESQCVDVLNGIWNRGQNCSSNNLDFVCKRCGAPPCRSCEFIRRTVNDVIALLVLPFEDILRGACCFNDTCFSDIQKRECRDKGSNAFWFYNSECSICLKTQQQAQYYGQSEDLPFLSAPVPLRVEDFSNTILTVFEWIINTTYNGVVIVVNAAFNQQWQIIDFDIREDLLNPVRRFIMTNDHEDPRSWSFWAFFIVNCDPIDHPRCDRGRQGLGLRRGLLVTTITIILLIILLNKFPGLNILGTLITGIILVIFFFALLFATSYMMSPACLIPASAPAFLVKAKEGTAKRYVLRLPKSIFRRILAIYLTIPMLPECLGDDIYDEIIEPIFNVSCLIDCTVSCPLEPYKWPCGWEIPTIPSNNVTNETCIPNATDCCSVATCHENGILPNCSAEPYNFNAFFREIFFLLRWKIPKVNCFLFHSNFFLFSWIDEVSQEIAKEKDFPGDECSPPDFVDERWKHCFKSNLLSLAFPILIFILSIVTLFVILPLLLLLLVAILKILKLWIDALYTSLLSLAGASMTNVQNRELMEKKKKKNVSGLEGGSSISSIIKQEVKSAGFQYRGATFTGPMRGEFKAKEDRE